MHRFLINIASGLRLPQLAAGGAAAGSAGGRATAFVALAGIGSVAYLQSYPRTIPEKDPTDSKLLLERPLMEMICGAVGEVAQVCVLYPLETIKVKCQSDQVSAVAALRAVCARGPVDAARALYSGIGAAAICSIIVGAVHYASFCMSKRAAMAAVADKGGGGGGHGGAHGGGGSGGATAVAAVVGAVSTALVESPCDLYRHMAQAGMIQGNFLAEMASAVKKDGPRALYWGFFAFCMESFPYDITELGSYGSLQDARDAALRRDDALGRRLAAVPTQVLDLAIGAVSGAAAVTVSMPFDVVKTYLQTHASEMAVKAGGGVWGEAVAFASTGAGMVRANGPGALFVGIAPRLVQQVPSSTICWYVIEQCRELLEPYTKA
ncbi:MAG: mitochondrial carrier domain-containing protein [Monoraphidium minutum]|nr:MAG: mitochondrial carrier domain-containing protein [Monoraphidium minutum]